MEVSFDLGLSEVGGFGADYEAGCVRLRLG